MTHQIIATLPNAYITYIIGSVFFEESSPPVKVESYYTVPTVFGFLFIGIFPGDGDKADTHRTLLVSYSGGHSKPPNIPHAKS